MSPPIQTKKAKLQRYLSLHRKKLFKNAQHRDAASKKTFSLVSSFKIGVGSTQPGHIAFVRRGMKGFVKHPTKEIGVRITPVAEQKELSVEQKELYRLAADLLAEIDADYARGEFLVQFAYMNDPSHYVRIHKDHGDISYQYALSLENYTGAKLRVYTCDERDFVEFNHLNRIVKFDGRCAHEVVTKDFDGERFTVIYYKNYDSRLVHPDPIFDTPCFVDQPTEAEGGVLDDDDELAL